MGDDCDQRFPILDISEFSCPKSLLIFVHQVLKAGFLKVRSHKTAKNLDKEPSTVIRLVEPEGSQQDPGSALSP